VDDSAAVRALAEFLLADTLATKARPARRHSATLLARPVGSERDWVTYVLDAMECMCVPEVSPPPSVSRQCPQARWRGLPSGAPAATRALRSCHSCTPIGAFAAAC